MVNNLIRYFKSIHFIKAFLVALAMAVPVLMSIYFFDRRDIGFSIALGAILCAPADVPGSLKHKFYGILVSIILAFAITFLIGYFNHWKLTPIAMLILFSNLAILCTIETFDFISDQWSLKAYITELTFYLITSLFLLNSALSKSHFIA